MTQILSNSTLLEQPHDSFWDGKPSRRELQAAFNKIGKNTEELMAMCDTAALALNYVCETLGVTRKQLDEYVAKKGAEVAGMRAAMKAEAAKTPNVLGGTQS